MKYEKTNEGFSLKDGELHVDDKMKKVGMVVDCYGYPARDPIVIKHGEYERVKKYYNDMKEKLMSSTVETKFYKKLSDSILFVDVSEWTADEINQSLDTMHYICNLLTSKNIPIPNGNV